MISESTPEPADGRLLQWGKILWAFFTAQGLAQLLSMSAGLVFIRLMEVHEYALYTLAFSVISFFTFVSDLGSTSSLVHFFHRTQGGAEFDGYRAAVFSLRRAVFAVGAVAVLAIFPVVAGPRGFDHAWPVGIAIVVGVGFQLSASIDLLLLRLADHYGQSYRAEIGGAGVRLVLALLLAALAFMPAWAGIASGSLALGVTAWLARPREPRTVPAGLDLGDFRRRVVRYLLPTLPSAVYFSFQGPLVVWLAATFGQTRNIAEVGALGRLGMIVGMFSGLVSIVFLPRLARVADDQLYRQRFLQFGAFLTALAAALWVGVWAFPQPFLFLLGKNYSGLHAELLIIVASAGLTLLDTYILGVNFARGWIRWQPATLVIQIAVQAVMVALLPLSSTANVLRFNLLTGLSALVLQTITVAVGFSRPSWVKWT